MHYKEKKISEHVFVREFNPELEYPWHRDAEDRLIEVLSLNSGWKFQKDNELPVDLYSGLNIDIKKNVFHRLIPGDSVLVLRITKNI